MVALLSVLGLIVALLVALQILLRPSVLTPMVNDFATEYIDGDVAFKEVKAHVIKSFPNLHLETRDLSITYPRQRFFPGESGIDTLASLRELDLALDYTALLKGKIHVRKAELKRPRIFAHYFDSTSANWDILPIGGNDKKDTSSSPLPPISVDKLVLTDRPFIAFNDHQDSIRAFFTMRKMLLSGELDSEDILQSKSELSIDSLLVAGRTTADTISFRLERLRANLGKRNLELEASAGARLRSGSIGRLSVPISLEASSHFPKLEEGELGAEIKRLSLGVSAIELEGSGSVIKRKDGVLDLDLGAMVKDCELAKLIKEYKDNFPVLQKIRTNAKLSLDAKVKGSMGNGQMPRIDAILQVPLSYLDYEGLGRRGNIALDAVVSRGEGEQTDASLNKLFLDIVGARISGSGSAKDILGEDPHFSLNATVNARADSLANAFLADMGIFGNGSLDAVIKGSAALSQLSLPKIGNADVKCSLKGKDLFFEIPRDSISLTLPTADIELETKANSIDRSLKKGARVLALKTQLDTLDATIGSSYFRGGDILLLMQNSAEILKGGKELTPLVGIMKVGNLRMRDGDGLAVGIKENTETFRISPATAERPSPRLALKSKSGGLRLRSGENVISLKDAAFDISAVKHVSKRRSTLTQTQGRPQMRFRPRRDSSSRRKDDFASADIHISLSKGLSEYFRNWDIDGNIDFPEGRTTIPAFPLRTSLSNVKGSFDNDTLNLRSITIRSGASDISANAQLSGTRRAILGHGRGKMQLTASVDSDYLDANELMRAYAHYRSYSSSSQTVPSEQQEVPAEGKLIVLPSNLDVDFSLEARGIHYDSLEVSWAAADVAMRDRTLRVTNALAASNMGDLYVEGFYATRSKQDIKAGFDLNLVDITAEKVITLFPAIDSIMPMLTSFAGDLDCEMAATTQLDTNMNIIMPSIDGVMRISGKELTLKDSKEFAKIAGMLMFKDKNKAVIDNMAVTGIINDNILEVFPFVMDVDRYLFAASGIQHLSKEFSYHISVIRSPLLVKFGLNAWGDDFDHIHYALAKAKYRSANVPVFTKQLDNAQYSLVAAIHNIFELGVEKAMEENRTGNFVEGGISTFGEPMDTTSVNITLESMEKMESNADSVARRVTTRREALKEEVLYLERQAALKSKEE